MSETPTKHRGFLCALTLAYSLPLLATASSYALTAVDGVPGARGPRGPNGFDDIGSAVVLESAKRLDVWQVTAVRPTVAPAAQNDTSGEVDKAGDENNGTQQGAAVPGQQPAVPLPASPPPSNPGNPSQAANTFEARRTLARACDSGEAPECYVLGILEQESGNLAEAKRLFAKACDGGNMRGCNNLGLLEKQSGNFATAKRLYLKACVGHDMRACTNLGALEKQSGNLAEARRLFAQACNGGEVLACSGLNALRSKGKAPAREQQFRRAESEEETEPYESVDRPFDVDAYTPEHGHLGLVLGLVKDSKGSGDLAYGLGLRVGWRPLPSVEIGVLVAAWESSWTVDAIPVLFQFNGIVPLNPLWSFFGGGQLGLLHYRLDTSGMGYDYGMVGLDAFAYGLQAGVSVRLTSNFSFRLELAWLHANEASTTLSSSGCGPGGCSFSTDTFGMEASNFFHANVAFCLTF